MYSCDPLSPTPRSRSNSHTATGQYIRATGCSSTAWGQRKSGSLEMGNRVNPTMAVFFLVLPINQGDKGYPQIQKQEHTHTTLTYVCSVVELCFRAF